MIFKHKIAVAFPWYEHRVDAMVALYWAYAVKPADCFFAVTVMPGQEIHEARQAFVDGMLSDQNTRWTHLLFMDDDTIIPHRAIPMLLDGDKDIIAGVGFKKDEAASLPITKRSDPQLDCMKLKPCIDCGEKGNINGKPCETCAGSGLIAGPVAEVDATGFALVLIKRKALVHMMKYVQKKYDSEEPLFRHDQDGCSEDIYFCNLARESGLKIHVDPRVRCAPMDYDGNLWNDSSVRKNFYHQGPEKIAEMRIKGLERHGLISDARKYIEQDVEPFFNVTRVKITK
jgi:hypothetical protein